MSTGDSGLRQETNDLHRTHIPCPHCENGMLLHSRKGNYLVCSECRRKVYEVCITAPRLELLLEAFDMLFGDCYDKEVGTSASYARSEMDAELEVRGFAPNDGNRTPDLAIPKGWLTLTGLTPTSISALNELRQDHEFEDGSAFLGSILKSLLHLEKLTAAQRRLRRQLEAIPFLAREALSNTLTTAQGD